MRKLFLILLPLLFVGCSKQDSMSGFTLEPNKKIEGGGVHDIKIQVNELTATIIEKPVPDDALTMPKHYKVKDVTRNDGLASTDNSNVVLNFEDGSHLTFLLSPDGTSICSDCPTTGNAKWPQSWIVTRNDVSK